MLNLVGIDLNINILNYKLPVTSYQWRGTGGAKARENIEREGYGRREKKDEKGREEVARNDRPTRLLNDRDFYTVFVVIDLFKVSLSRACL